MKHMFSLTLYDHHDTLVIWHVIYITLGFTKKLLKSNGFKWRLLLEFLYENIILICVLLRTSIIIIPSVRSNALRAIRGARILSFLGKLLVSDGFAEAMPDVGKYDD